MHSVFSSAAPRNVNCPPALCSNHLFHSPIAIRLPRAAVYNTRATANCLTTVSKYRHTVAVAIARRLGCSCRQSVCRRDVWHTSCFLTGRGNTNDERTFWDERLQNSSNPLCSTLRAGAGYSFCAAVGAARDSRTEHSVCAKPDGSAGRGTTA